MAIKAAIVNKNLRPSLPLESECCPPEFCDLITACWAGVPKDRPLFESIVPRLCSMLSLEDDDDWQLRKHVESAKADPVLTNLFDVSTAAGCSSAAKVIEESNPSRHDLLFESGSVALPAQATAALVVDSSSEVVWIGFADGTIGAYTMLDGLELALWSAHDTAVRNLAYIEETDTVWSASEDGDVCLWAASSVRVYLYLSH